MRCLKVNKYLYFETEGVNRIRRSEGPTDDRHRSADLSPLSEEVNDWKNKTGRIHSTGQSPDLTPPACPVGLWSIRCQNRRGSAWPGGGGGGHRRKGPLVATAGQPDRPLATEWAAAEIRDGGAFTSWRAVAASGADVATGHGRRRGAREQSLAHRGTVNSGW